jgi:hypothetical protein
MKAGLTAVSQATHSARPRLLANLPNALAIALPTIQIPGTLVPGNSQDRTFDGHALSSDLKKRRTVMFQGVQTGCRISAKSPARWHFLAYNLTRVMNTVGIKPVCTENLIRVDDVMESPKLAE